MMLAAAAAVPTLTSGGPGSSCARPLPKTAIGGVDLESSFADQTLNLTR